MSISFENAVSTLRAMFPDWDAETLSAILISNNYHVERTIETVLSMSDSSAAGENEKNTSQNGDSSAPAAPLVDLSPSTGPSAAPAAPVGSPSRAHAAEKQGEKAVVTAQGESRANAYREKRVHGHDGVVRRSHGHVHSQSSSGRRGAPCELPPDFLRAPGYVPRGAQRDITDEELALMLQNEIFQREARAALGDDYDRAFTHRHATQPQAAAAPRRESLSRASSSSQQPSQSTAQSGGESDLGIVKSLSSMGSAAKRNLVLLAQRFSSRESASQAATGEYSRSTESGTAREFKPLVDGHDDDEEENAVEIISFDSGANSRSRHVLQGDNGDSDDFSSSNPLIEPKYRHNI